MPTNTAPTPALWDAAALAAALSVSKPTIWRMREAGRLPEPIALTSQCLRWRRADIERWIAAGCPSCAATARAVAARQEKQNGRTRQTSDRSPLVPRPSLPSGLTT